MNHESLIFSFGRKPDTTTLTGNLVGYEMRGFETGEMDPDAVIVLAKNDYKMVGEQCLAFTGIDIYAAYDNPRFHNKVNCDIAYRNSGELMIVPQGSYSSMRKSIQHKNAKNDRINATMAVLNDSTIPQNKTNDNTVAQIEKKDTNVGMGCGACVVCFIFGIAFLIVGVINLTKEFGMSLFFIALSVLCWYVLYQDFFGHEKKDK